MNINPNIRPNNPDIRPNNNLFPNNPTNNPINNPNIRPNPINNQIYNPSNPLFPSTSLNTLTQSFDVTCRCSNKFTICNKLFSGNCSKCKASVNLTYQCSKCNVEYCEACIKLLIDNNKNRNK